MLGTKGVASALIGFVIAGGLLRLGTRLVIGHSKVPAAGPRTIRHTTETQPHICLVACEGCKPFTRRIVTRNYLFYYRFASFHGLDVKTNALINIP